MSSRLRMGMKWLRRCLAFLALAGYACGPLADAPPSARAPVAQMEIDGPIGPATSDYLERALERAAVQGAQLAVIRMDTPGGLDGAMRDIIKRILASPVPVAVHVAPGGARAASAGTYILYAAHIAAMAPGTNLGAATPVRIGAPPTPAKPGQPERPKKDAAGDDDAMHRKLVNDAIAYIRGLAELRGRNADWAERAVREAASLSAERALELRVIDLVATDTADLLQKIDGRSVVVPGGERVLNLDGAALQSIAPDWRNRLLTVITDPNVAYVLLLLGIYGLLLEFYNPGGMVAGTTGAICLLLALYAFQVLPVNLAGLALMGLGIGLMVAEAFVPSFGALGIGGVAAFVLGSVMLLDTDVPGFTIDPMLIGAFAAASLLFFVLVLGYAVRAWHRPVVSGREEMLGGTAVALEDFCGPGRVRIHSEIWSARSAVPVRAGQRVRVQDIDGLTLTVTPLPSEPGD